MVRKIVHGRARVKLKRFASPSGEALNVGQMHTLFAQAILDQAIRNGESDQPIFETAVELHRLVDAIKQALDNGPEVTFQ